jgi:sulfopyruvate decarboxylase TPP-binding subunit
MLNQLTVLIKNTPKGTRLEALCSVSLLESLPKFLIVSWFLEGFLKEVSTFVYRLQDNVYRL